MTRGPSGAAGAAAAGPDAAGSFNLPVEAGSPMPDTLLLADDSATIQRVIEMTFAEEDVRVVAVGDGREAMERIAADPPDIVLADTHMPEKDGYDVSAFVKADGALSHIPVVLLTGAFDPVDDARAREVGCDAVLVKPFEPKAVLERVRELLGAPDSGSAAAAGAPAAPRPEPEPANAAPRPREAPGSDAAPGSPASADAAAPKAPVDAAPESPASADAAASKASVGAAAPGSPASADASAPKTPVAPASPAAASKSPVGAAAPGPPASAPKSPAAAPVVTPSTSGGGDGPAEPDPASAASGRAAPPTWAEAAGAPPPAPAVPAVEAPPPPSLADAFAALLAAEQGDVDRARAAWPWPRRGAPAGEDDLVERVAERVVERLSDDVTGELVSEVVARVAERMVRDQIGRIKPA